MAIIGMGEVGTIFADGLSGRPGVELCLSSRSAAAAAGKAGRKERPVLSDPAEAVETAGLVLLTVSSGGLNDVAGRIAQRLRPGTVVVDLSSSPPELVTEAMAKVAAAGGIPVDGAIMGAVSMQGLSTPIVLSGEAAGQCRDAMEALGFTVRAMPGSRIGDASRAKLLRSIFAKGLEALMIESALAARAAGLEEEFLLQLDNTDRMPLRQHLDMYLRTHAWHAARRLSEMEASQAQLIASGVSSRTTRAAIDRYSRTTELLAEGPPEGSDAASVLSWLLKGEQADLPQKGQHP